MVRHVVLGGGVAGVCCVEELCRLCPNDTVTLVSVSSTLKVRCAQPASVAIPAWRTLYKKKNCPDHCMPMLFIFFAPFLTSHLPINQGVSTIAKLTKTIEELKCEQQEWNQSAAISIHWLLHCSLNFSFIYIFSPTMHRGLLCCCYLRRTPLFVFQNIPYNPHICSN
jgi:hypothetical protein